MNQSQKSRRQQECAYSLNELRWKKKTNGNENNTHKEKHTKDEGSTQSDEISKS